MLRIIYFIIDVFVTHRPVKFLSPSVLLIFFCCSQSLLMAQPITSGSLENEMYFEEMQTAYHEPGEGIIIKDSMPKNTGYAQTTLPKQSGNGFLMVAGAVFFGFITLLFLKIAAKNKVILLIIGLITLLIMNAQAQPEINSVNNQAYFEELPGRMGPASTYSTTAPMGTMQEDPPEFPVPIDTGLGIMMIAGIIIGIYSIYYSQTKKAT